MEPCKDAISVRITRLNTQLLNKTTKEKTQNLTRETLYDALQLLYDECNTETLKSSDKNISNFIDRYRKTLLELKQLRVNLSDFEIKNVIGQGHFGEVHMVKERQTGDVYAMKIVKKFENTEQNYEEERNIMALASSPWITKLQYAFQDNLNLYFIMEYHAGGDLLGLLLRQGGTLPESAATFYLAEILLGINDLHLMGFVHRDIKPDNVLLDCCGHVKLADFGSASKLNSKGFVSGGNPVGTPDYIAPEALQSFDKKTGAGYGQGCDYWSLGVLAYELTVGATPFQSPNTTSTYSKIMNHQKSLKFPPEITLSEAYVHLVKSLLTDQNSRLDFPQLVKHPLFKHLDFSSLRDKLPPFVPKILSIEDTSNFTDITPKKKQPNIENFKHKTKFSFKNLPFLGFTYTTEPQDYKEPYRASAVVNDGKVERLKKEVDALQRDLLRFAGVEEEKEGLERRLEEKVRKLEGVESVRDRLERDLANNIAESQALKRTLDLERKDRTELERKALEIIKVAKQKWEAAEKVKMESVLKELEEAHEKTGMLTLEVQHLNKELRRALQTSDQHKASVENVEKLRRASVVGLESRLEKVTTENQQRISLLQSKLSEESRANESIQTRIRQLEKSEESLKNQLALSDKNFHELQTQCLQSESLIEDLKREIKDLRSRSAELDKYKLLVKTLEDELSELQRKKSEDEAEITAVLKKQIKDLKSELNAMLSNKLTSMNDLKEGFETKVAGLEGRLRAVEKEKGELEVKCREAELSLKSKEEKVTTLEELMNRLQEDLGKLENGSEREGVLQEQVERLEQQLVEVHETLALEKQESSNLKSKYWRMEKDLTNADLDRKIVERDLKEAQKESQNLQKEIAQLRQQIDSDAQTHQDSLRTLETSNQQLLQEVQSLQQQLHALQQQLRREQEKEASAAQQVEAMRKNVESKELKVCSVLKTLNDVKNQKSLADRRLHEVLGEKEDLKLQLEDAKKANDRLHDDVTQCQKNLQRCIADRDTLQEACTIIETQLDEFEKLIDYTEARRTEVQLELEAACKLMNGQKDDIVACKKFLNEERSRRLLAETRWKRSAEELESLNQNLESYQKQVREYKDYSEQLSDQLTNVEQLLTDFKIKAKSYERQIDDYISENNYLKEENSEQLTFINRAKESNYNLSKNLAESQASVKDLMDKVIDLETELQEKNQYYAEREHKDNAKCEQQTKLIDFLQSMMDENNKKKKTLTDKLFGHSKKENLPPISVALNYKEMEQQLKKEREQNKLLHQEIVRLKGETYAKAETDLKRHAQRHVDVQDEVLAQIVQSPSSQKNDLYRQNSVQRMHHNIPHRFDTKICTKPTKCAQCGNQVPLGRNSSVCRECHLVTHPTCSAQLPRTCGLPIAYAKHYTDSLSKLGGAKPLDQSPPDFDEISIEGWVKIPIGSSGWEKHYATLSNSTLCVYPEPPIGRQMEPAQTLQLYPTSEHGKVILEPLPAEVGVPVANSDLPFVIKVETSPNSTCWPPQCIIFMTLSIEDREKWFKGLQNIFHNPDKYLGETVLRPDDPALDPNTVVVLAKDLLLIGTESGLHALQKPKPLLHISGPTRVSEIALVPSASSALLIIDQSRCLVQADINHLLSLSQCAQLTKPALKFKPVCGNLIGFHMLKASEKCVCVANMKHLVILRFDEGKNEFFAQRVLDTAQPVSCVLFAAHSLIIGADKFFEVDLSTNQAEEFLDASDSKLAIAVKTYKNSSFPIAILQISQSPVEYLVCFNEFAMFVDAYGRSSRPCELRWLHLPHSFHYSSPHLYVVEFNALEILKITEQTGCAHQKPESFKVELNAPRLLGHCESGVYVGGVGGAVKLFSANVFDDDASSSTTEKTAADRFSFTSSMVQSLDGNLSDEEEKKVRFAGVVTDL